MLKNVASHLADLGLIHGVAGMDYDFRQAHGEEGYERDLRCAFDALGIKPDRFFHANQVHGHRVAMVDHEEAEDYFAGYPIYAETDGLITARPGTGLLVRMADCTPVLIYDPVHHVLGLAHSGWRSTVQGISQRVLDLMGQHYGSKPDQVLVYLGPSIGQEDYQVGAEVYEAFQAIGNRDAYFRPDADCYRLSMIEANRQVLLKAGVKADHIQAASQLTFSSSSLHSARREGADYGLNAMIAYLP